MAPLSATAMHCERIVKFPRQRILGVSLAFLLASGPLLGQTLGRPGLRGKSDTLPDSPALKIPAEEQNEATGIVLGTIFDSTGVMVAGAMQNAAHGPSPGAILLPSLLFRPPRCNGFLGNLRALCG